VLNVVYEVSLPDATATVDLPELTALGVNREMGYVGVAAKNQHRNFGRVVGKPRAGRCFEIARQHQLQTPAIRSSSASNTRPPVRAKAQSGQARRDRSAHMRRGQASSLQFCDNRRRISDARRFQDQKQSRAVYSHRPAQRRAGLQRFQKRPTHFSRRRTTKETFCCRSKKLRAPPETRCRSSWKLLISSSFRKWENISADGNSIRSQRICLRTNSNGIFICRINQL